MDDDLLETLLLKKYSRRPFYDVYMSFKKHTGVTKKILGNLVAQKLNEYGALYDIDDLGDILDSASLDTLWDTYSESKDELIRAECFKRIEGFIAEIDNMDLIKEKNGGKGKRKVKNRIKNSGGIK